MATFLEVPYLSLPLKKFASDNSIPVSTAKDINHSITGSLPGTPNRILDIKVFTPDGNSIPVPLKLGNSSSAECLLECVLEILNIDVTSGVEVFSLWIISPYLELQLKPSHRPIRLLQQWKSLLLLYSDLGVDEIKYDSPILTIKRSAFLTMKREKQLECDKILTFLFYEAKDNFLLSRYPLHDNNETLKLGAYLLLSEEGKYDESAHSVEWLLSQFRIRQFLPVKLSSGKSPFCVSSHSKKVSLAKQLIHSLKIQCTKGHSINTLRKLFIQACQNLPYYGAVFFRAQVERPSNFFTRLAFGVQDRQILVALSADTLHILDHESADVMFTLYHQHYTWEYQPPSRSGEDEFCSIWIEFNSVLEDSTVVAKQLQIFSKQAPLMDSLISNHTTHMNDRNFTHHKQSTGAEPISALRVDEPTRTPHVGEKHFSLYSFSMDGEKIPNSKVRRRLTSFKKSNTKT